MSEGKIENWVRSKLDEGVDPQKLKKVLQKNGHDPAVVDSVKEQDRAPEGFESRADKEEPVNTPSVERNSRSREDSDMKRAVSEQTEAEKVEALHEKNTSKPSKSRIKGFLEKFAVEDTDMTLVVLIFIVTVLTGFIIGSIV